MLDTVTYYFPLGHFYVKVTEKKPEGIEFLDFMFFKYFPGEGYTKVKEIPVQETVNVFNLATEEGDDSFEVICYSSRRLDENNKQFYDFWDSMWDILLK